VTLVFHTLGLFQIATMEMMVTVNGVKEWRDVQTVDAEGSHPVLNKGEVEVHTADGQVVIVTPQPENSNGTKVHHHGRRRRR
jgi:hypothetical protein